MRREGDIPEEIFERNVDWPFPRPDPEREHSHPDRIPDDEPGPYRWP